MPKCTNYSAFEVHKVFANHPPSSQKGLEWRILQCVQSSFSAFSQLLCNYQLPTLWIYRPNQPYLFKHSCRNRLLKLETFICTICWACSKQMKLPAQVVVTVEVHRLDHWILDWTTAVAGKADRCQLSVSFIYHSIGPIQDSLVQSMNFHSSTIKVGY